MNRSIDCRNTLIPRAKRSAPLKNAPSSWARCHPKDKDLGASFVSDTYAQGDRSPHISRLGGLWEDSRHPTRRATNATMKPIRSFSWMLISNASTQFLRGHESVHSGRHQRPKPKNAYKIRLRDNLSDYPSLRRLSLRQQGANTGEREEREEAEEQGVFTGNLRHEENRGNPNHGGQTL